MQLLEVHEIAAGVVEHGMGAPIAIGGLLTEYDAALFEPRAFLANVGDGEHHRGLRGGIGIRLEQQRRTVGLLGRHDGRQAERRRQPLFDEAEHAARAADGPGSFAVALLDALAGIDPADIEAEARVDESAGRIEAGAL